MNDMEQEIAERSQEFWAAVDERDAQRGPDDRTVYADGEQWRQIREEIERQYA